MKDFLRVYKIQVIVGIYLVIFAAFFYFFCLPIVAEINSKADEIQQKKIDSEINEKRLADVPVMEENFGKFKENENSFTMLIEPNSEVELIKELEALAAQTNNKIEFKIQDPADGKTAVKQKAVEGSVKSKLSYTNYLSMQIAIEGNYANLLSFIHKLENYKKTINVMSVSSEKKEPDVPVNNPNPFDVTVAKKGLTGKEVINSILDIVVYIKK